MISSQYEYRSLGILRFLYFCIGLCSNSILSTLVTDSFWCTFRFVQSFWPKWMKSGDMLNWQVLQLHLQEPMEIVHVWTNRCITPQKKCFEIHHLKKWTRMLESWIWSCEIANVNSKSVQCVLNIWDYKWWSYTNNYYLKGKDRFEYEYENSPQTYFWYWSTSQTRMHR